MPPNSCAFLQLLSDYAVQFSQHADAAATGHAQQPGSKASGISSSVLAACGVALCAVVTASVDVRAGAAIAVASVLAAVAYTRVGTSQHGERRWELTVDPALPTTTIKVKLVTKTAEGASGGDPTNKTKKSSVEIVCNHEVHTVADLHRRVAQIGSLELGSFVLVCGFPPATLAMDEETTIASAGLKGALVTQRATQ